jgi:hypothetical protein
VRASRVIVDPNARISNAARKKNARIEKFDSGIPKILPHRCRSDDSPVPFGKGWMTVVAEADFQ